MTNRRALVVDVSGILAIVVVMLLHQFFFLVIAAAAAFDFGITTAILESLLL